jgi:uncharacterized protein (TIGR00369 family)
MAGEIAEREEKPHFAGLLGIEWLDDDPAAAHARLAVRDELLQPFGIVHGGVLSTLVESVCSRATALAVYGEGMVAMGQSINVSFLRPISAGSIEVLATARHRGRTTWVWEVEITDDQERLCALVRMTIAVR